MRLPVRALGEARDLALFLDYDGTLVGLRRRPEEARLSPGRRAVLDSISRTARVAVVSGRSLADVRALVGLPSLIYVGNHGLEIAEGGMTWTHPAAAGAKRALAAVMREVRSRAAALEGVLVEDKGATAAVHFRLLAPGDVPELKAVVEEAVGRNRGVLRTVPGKKVIDVRPDVGWDKGRAVIELLGRMGPAKGRQVIYIGDDRTDEDAFRALGGRAVTVRVGASGVSSAAHRLRGVGAVWMFLRELADRRTA